MGSERLSRLSRLRPGRPLLMVGGALVGFAAVLAGQLQPAAPEGRLPESQRLAALIERQSNDNAAQRAVVEDLRRQVEAERERRLALQEGRQGDSRLVAQASLTAGLTPMQGTGFTVSLNDSTLDEAPSGNVNDLVIHSYDVQAVVNAMWAAGAEAVSINGERVVGTSAILCVGNTLLLNGTVHAPPYEITAIGANRRQYTDDPAVNALERTAERYSLRYSVSGEKDVTIPGYDGTIEPSFANVVLPSRS